MKEMKSVPMPIYENEMRSKNNVITCLFITILLLIVVIGVSVYMFVKFISTYDYLGYEQNGEGVNNINNYSNQGDILNESEINN